jgi:hypothetical protein
MIKESIKDLITAIAEGDSIAIEDSFNYVMASKISDHLDNMRLSVAQGMFGSVVEEGYDSRDAYDLHDPKHPDFVKNHTKWKKANPEGKLGDFIAHMKTKRFNVTESAGAYETWDPKHPKFKEKLIKHHAQGGTTKSFIEKEKAKAWKQLTRESVEEFTLEDYSVEELEDFMMSEDFEQLDEVSKKTLGSYVNKAHDQLMKHTAAVNFKSGRGDKDVLSYTHEPTTARKTANRTKGVATAIGKLTKEELEELEESFLSNTSSTHPTLAGKLNKLRSIHKTLTAAGYSTNNKDHLSQDSNHMGNPNSNTVTYKKSGTADVTINHGGSANPKTLYSVKSSKGAGKKVNLPEELTLEDYSLEELEDFMMSEDFEQLDELSKATLGSYVKKAGSYNIDKGLTAGDNLASGRREKAIDIRNDISKREKNIGKAVDKLTKD